MADVRSAWNDAGNQLSELGQKLKSRYEEQHGSETAETKQEVADAAKRLGSAVQDAFEALGAAARDKSVQADIKQVGQAVYDALGVTFGQISEDVRRTFSERKGEAVYDQVPDAEPAGPTAGEPTAGEPTAGGTPTTGEQEPPPAAPKVEPWGTP